VSSITPPCGHKEVCDTWRCYVPAGVILLLAKNPNRLSAYETTRLTVKNDATAYDVLLEGKLVGYVKSRRVESCTQVGRLRGHKIGEPKYWAAYAADHREISSINYTRRSALQLVVLDAQGKLRYQ
jgi:hypothetical protein